MQQFPQKLLMKWKERTENKYTAQNHIIRKRGNLQKFVFGFYEIFQYSHFSPANSIWCSSKNQLRKIDSLSGWVTDLGKTMLHYWERHVHCLHHVFTHIHLNYPAELLFPSRNNNASSVAYFSDSPPRSLWIVHLNRCLRPEGKTWRRSNRIFLLWPNLEIITRILLSRSANIGNTD